MLTLSTPSRHTLVVTTSCLCSSALFRFSFALILESAIPAFRMKDANAAVCAVTFSRKCKMVEVVTDCGVKKNETLKKKKGKKKPLRSDFSQDFLRTAATTEIHETWSQNSSSQHSQRSESDVIVCLDHCHIFLYIFFLYQYYCYYKF